MSYLPAVLRMSMFAGVAVLGAAFVACGAGMPANGAAPSGTNPIYERDGVALGGYDPVAYFVDREAVAGSPMYQVNWKGAIWRFSSVEHAQLFEEEPERFAPQYGGYSLYGMSRGKAYGTDPRVFDIIDDKLYLSRNEAVREIWQRNPTGYIETADTRWGQANWSEAPNQLVR